MPGLYDSALLDAGAAGARTAVAEKAMSQAEELAKATPPDLKYSIFASGGGDPRFSRQFLRACERISCAFGPARSARC